MGKKKSGTAVLELSTDDAVTPPKPDRGNDAEPEIMTILTEDQYTRVLPIALVYAEIGFSLDDFLDTYRSHKDPEIALRKDEAVTSVFLTYSAGKSYTIGEKAGLLCVLGRLSGSGPSRGLGHYLPKSKGMPTLKLLDEILMCAERLEHRPLVTVENGIPRLQGRPRKEYAHIGEREKLLRSIMRSKDIWE